jgi:PAS domain S-box-containing protein
MGFADDAACPEAGAASFMWLNRVINTIPQAIYWKDQNNRFLGCNQAFAQTVGLSDPAAILGKSDGELPDEIQRQLLSDRDRVVLTTNQPEHHTLELTDIGDRPTWIKVQKLPLQDDNDGSAIGVVCTMEDITAVKQAELQLQASESELRTFFSAMTDVVLVRDAKGRCLKIAPTNPINLVKPLEEMLGKTLHEVMPLAQANLILAHIHQALEAQQSVYCEYSVRAGDLNVWLGARISPLSQNAVILAARDITETKEAEHQIRDSKAFLKQVLNGVDDPIFVKDRDHRWVLVNDSFCRFLGRDRTELFNKSDYDFFPTAEADVFWQTDEWVFTNGDTVENEESLTNKDGKTITISTKKSSFTDQNNHQFLVGTIRDITDRKRAEFALADLNEALEARVENRTAALRESEARLRTLMDNLPIGVWATDINSRYIMQNATALEQWGDLVGKQPQDLNLAPEVIDRWLEEQQRVFSGETLYKEDYDRRSNQDWFCSTILAPIWDGDRITGLLGTSINITEHKRTEAALRENENTLRGILQNMPVMMDAFDEHGNIITWNSECERVTGYSADEIIGNPNAMELLYADPVYREEMMQTWTQLGNNYRNWEWKVWCKDGTFKTVIWSNLSGQFPVPGWANWGIAIDISDRKQAELQLQASETCLRQQAHELTDTLKELQRTQSQLVQSEKMSSLGQLVAGVAHEINNPVNFIYGNLTYADEYVNDLLDLLELYQQEYSTPTATIRDKIEAIDLSFLLEDLPKLLNSMKVGAERIQAIVASLRTFSRMDEAEVKAVDIHEGIDSTLMILQSRLKGTHERSAISVVKNYGDLPLVECYAGQLNQVFMNILSNAIDALEESSQSSISNSALKNSDLNIEPQLASNSPCITIHTELISAERIIMSITDNGTGIPDSVQQRLFDPFFTTKEVGKGTGMGLSISYQIVTEKHGGSLECFSALGQGAEFRIEIPISQCST